MKMYTDSTWVSGSSGGRNETLLFVFRNLISFSIFNPPTHTQTHIYTQQASYAAVCKELKMCHLNLQSSEAKVYVCVREIERESICVYLVVCLCLCACVCVCA